VRVEWEAKDESRDASFQDRLLYQPFPSVVFVDFSVAYQESS